MPQSAANQLETKDFHSVTSLFISYCRREAPFVDSLLGRLEKQGFTVWLDYHTLIPGKPWKEQIYEGIVQGDVFLLVVSKESIVSENVEWEWRQAIELEKRIVLVIFEAVKLPAELEACEWVDLRGSFRTGVKKLRAQLETAKKTKLPPQKGFKAPVIVWVAFLISLMAALISVTSVWTLCIPYYLVPLPYRILKRNFSFFQVQMALLLLPLTAFGGACIFLPREGESLVGNFSLWCWSLSLLVVPLLLLVLRSSGMQRWGKPIASRPKFSNPYVPKVRSPKPVRFAMDFAPEDQKYANAIIRKLKKYKHSHITNASEAETIIVLLSAFKNTTAFDPEKQVVYPVILQSIQDLDPQLQRFQWIDFRQGLKNLDQFAQLLPEPTKLLKALGIVPVGYQIVLPPVVAVFTYYLTLLAVFTVTGSGLFLFCTKVELSLKWAALLAASLMFSLLVFLAIFLTVRSLISRKGRMASLHSLLLAVVTLGGMASVQLMAGSWYYSGEVLVPAGAAIGILIVCGFYITGLVYAGLFAIWHWRDLWRWFPARTRKLRR